ncbi:WXG100-like domain-containing protein [Mycolicibacterium houstonense]|uniref:WXG100-like domain-containing protein n=1 Tax=Mycolicibacterium houstonense TaxID=146021 RepID=UPI003F997947
MTLQIPASLQWVSYLVGYQWPKGDEDAMYRIGGEWGDRAGQLTSLSPELNIMRARTRAVLQGVTGGAADKEFALLFDGEASVDKLAEAMGALGTLAESTGKNIEYTKLQILTSLAIAAFEISWALAQTSVTFGASAAAIPVIEGTTSVAIRQVVAMLLKDIMTDLGKAMTKTTVHRIVKKSGVEAAEAVGQELFIQGVQQSKGHQQGYDWNRLGTVAVANSVGGAAQGTVSIYGQRALGNSTAKGAVVGYAAGMSKKVAGSLATGQPLDIVAILGSAPTAATGAVRGRAAAHSTRASTADGGGAAAASGGDGD